MNAEGEGQRRLYDYQIELFDRLRVTLAGLDVYARLSDCRLHLLSEDDVDAPARVSVFWTDFWFELTFQMPPEHAPWPDAYLCVSGCGDEESLETIREAIKRSGAWPADKG